MAIQAYTTESINIQGTIQGYIWWPQTECTKPFQYSVDKEETLRDALLSATNDGDFQSACVRDCMVTVRRRAGQFSHTRTLFLEHGNVSDGLRDLFVPTDEQVFFDGEDY